MRTLVPHLMLSLLVAACGGDSSNPADPDASTTGDGKPEPDGPITPPGPTPLAMGEASPNAIAVFNGEVFWTTDPGPNAGAVRKLAAGGGPITLAGQENQPRSLAVGMGLIEPTAYWGTANLQGQVRQIATTGAPPLSGVTVNDLVYTIALDGDSVFAGTRSTVYRKSVANAGGGLTNIAGGYGNGVTALAADATGVVFGARQLNGTWIVATVSRTGGTVTLRATSTETIRDIAIVGSTIFWLEGRLVRTVPRVGGTIQTVKTFQSETPWALVASQGKLFIATNSGVINPSGAIGRIIEIDTATLAERELAKGQPEPSDVAVDATNVYWSNRGLPGGTGSIMHIAR